MIEKRNDLFEKFEKNQSDIVEKLKLLSHGIQNRDTIDATAKGNSSRINQHMSDGVME